MSARDSQGLATILGNAIPQVSAPWQMQKMRQQSECTLAFEDRQASRSVVLESMPATSKLATF